MKAFFGNCRLWLRKRGYLNPPIAISVLLSGWIVAILMMETNGVNRSFLVDVLTAVGTVAAALAAYEAANLTRQAQERQIEREEQAMRPSLEWETTTLHISTRVEARPEVPKTGFEDLDSYFHGQVDVENVTSHAISLREVFLDSDTMAQLNTPLLREPARQLVAPGQKGQLILFGQGQLDIKGIGYLLITLRYSPTGGLIHPFLWKFALPSPPQNFANHDSYIAVMISGVLTRNALSPKEFEHALSQRQDFYSTFKE